MVLPMDSYQIIAAEGEYEQQVSYSNVLLMSPPILTILNV